MSMGCARLFKCSCSSASIIKYLAVLLAAEEIIAKTMSRRAKKKRDITVYFASDASIHK